MDKLVITWEGMCDYLPVPIEYRFVDWAEIIRGKEAWGYKAVSSQDWYFRTHFPGNPIMPGVMVMDLFQQTALMILKSSSSINETDMLFSSCERMRMFHSVRPGDFLTAHVELEFFSYGVAGFYGEVKIKRPYEKKEFLACSMKFSMIRKNQLLSLTGKVTNELESTTTIESVNTRIYDFSNFDKYLADPSEYRFIDKAVVLDNVGKGLKLSSSMDWYYGYYGNIMPVGCIMEAIMQTGVLVVTQNEEIKNPLMMFNDCNSLRMHGVVRPGDVIKTHVELRDYRRGVARFEGFAGVDDYLVCVMNFSLLLPEELVKLSERLPKGGIK